MIPSLTCVRLVLIAATVCNLTAVTLAQDSIDVVVEHLGGGEFAAARQVADRLPPAERDEALAKITQAQVRSAEWVAAAVTLRGIADPKYRHAATANHYAESPLPVSPPIGNQNARGGGSMADFDSLMLLIQQTISPDTWEALGGPSTMAPYPQGILVDPDGTVREVESMATGDAFADLERMLSPDAESSSFSESPRPNEWRRASAMRVVSLRRLRDEIASRQLVGMPLSESLVYLAGISEISHLAILDNDVLIAGTVGGIQSRQGWLVDAQTGQHPLRLDFFRAATHSAFGGQPFGCTIDPTLEGLARARQVAVDVQNDQLPIGAAAKKLAASLGKQRVEVFGTEGNTTLGLLMVEADRHMKQLALGEVAMPEGVSNYLDFVDQMIAQGPPADVLIRLWFTSNPQRVQADAERHVFRLSGRPLRLSGQNERSVKQGRARVADDPRTVALVEEFNQRFELIRAKYPIYGALESLYRAAALAELVNRFAQEEPNRNVLQSIADMELFAGSDVNGNRPQTPTSVDSIATLHTVRFGRTRHHILLASGGVFVDLKQSIAEKVETYPTLANVVPEVKRQPIVIDRWWWDATGSSGSRAYR